jgi:hypothetical protein
MKVTSALMCIVAGLVITAPLDADTIRQKGQVRANGITIAYESFGKPDGETILLVGGTGMQLTDWPTEFCEELASRGYRVVIYDNRDIGLSCKFDAAAMPDFAVVIQAAAAGKAAPLTMGIRRASRNERDALLKMGVDVGITRTMDNTYTRMGPAWRTH